MDSFKIGLSATLSGRHAVQGRESLRGIKLFTEELRSRGGIETQDGKSLVPELVFYDDESIPEKTKENTLRLIEKDRVDILLGPYSSSLTLACVETAESAQRVVWNYGGSLDDIPSRARGKTVSAITGASSYFQAVVDMIHDCYSQAVELFVLRLAGSRFSQTVCEGALLRAEKLGISAAVYDFPSGTEDFSTILARPKSRSASCVLCCGGMEDDINLAKWVRKNSDLDFGVVATLAAAVNEFDKRLGREADGFVSTSQWEPTLSLSPDFGPSPKEFSDRFARAYGYTPDYTAAQSYNMGLIIEKLIERTGETDEQTLLCEALRSRFTTFYGDFRIDPETLRQMGHGMLVTQWQDGEKKIVFPKEYSNSRLIV
ncbi:MAG: ABC transporter substrate-binding protein [Candidatus Dadabacteria bacterium]|nr:ABC transporter substrate-binding protein [Candidatus Dadabacteria bacterium]MYE61507.1 ABC transporter substrate-binding protein [Candidatus Dadabacteria bacterium]